ncbi:MAG: hypothetical protein ACYSU7_17635, partial [Planctomycetota bacterium]
MPKVKIHALLISLTVTAAATAPLSAGPAGRTIVASRTLQAALGQPLVHVQLSDKERVLTARPTPLDQLRGDGQETVRSFPAFLDTGSSAFVISRATAERFGIESVVDATYREVGLHGSISLGVSQPYGVALADFHGQASDPDEFRKIR